jgi:hypothetical protein
MMLSIRRLLGVSLLIAGLFVTWNPSASADPVSALGRIGTYVDQVGAGMHTCRNNTSACAPLEVNQPGTALWSFCFRTGQSLNDNPWWDIVYNPATGRAGWTNEQWLADQSQSTACATTDDYPVGSAAQAGAGIHTCRHNTCAALGFVNGHTVIALCKESGQTIGGTQWWSLIYDRTSDVVGWTNNAWLTAPAGSFCPVAA